MMSKMSSRPPLSKLDLQKLQEQFIEKGVVEEVLEEKPTEILQPIALVQKTEIPSPTLKPWEKDNVRNDVIKVFNLRFTEPYYLKLEYLSSKTRESKQSICINAIKNYLDTALDNME